MIFVFSPLCEPNFLLCIFVLKINYKGMLNMFDVQHVDRIHKEDHVVENSVQKFRFLHKLLFMIHACFPMRVFSLELRIDLGP